MSTDNGEVVVSQEALEPLTDELKIVLKHLRHDLSSAAEDGVPDSLALEALAARTIRAIAEGDERASLVRKRIESQWTEGNARKAALIERTATLSKTTSDLESHDDSTVIWPRHAIAVAIGCWFVTAIAANLLGLRGVSAITLAGGALLFGGAAAYALYAMGVRQTASRVGAFAAVALVSAIMALAFALDDNLAAAPFAFVAACAILGCAIGFGLAEGALGTESERGRRQLLQKTRNGLAAATAELERVLPGELARSGESAKALVEVEGSHHDQAAEDFRSTASSVISRADLASRAELEALRESLTDRIRDAAQSHLTIAVRPTSTTPDSHDTTLA